MSLEAALEADPDDDATWSVYVDALLAAGDPRGELGAIQRELRSNPADVELRAAEQRFLKSRGRALIGPAATELGYSIDWHYGHVRSIEIAEPYGAEIRAAVLLAELLARPAAQFLRAIAIRPPSWPAATSDSRTAMSRRRSRDGDLIDAIAGAPLRMLRRLELGELYFYDSVGLDEEGRDVLAFAVGDLGNLDRLWRAVPRLRELVISGGYFELGAIRLGELCDLELRQSSLRSTDLASLRTAELPELQRLSIWAGAHDDYGGATADYTAAELAALADPLRFPKLRELGLVSTHDTSRIAEHVLDSRMLPQLAILDLSGGTLTALDVVDPTAVAHLERLDVRHNLLDVAATRQLATSLPQLVFEPQRNERSFTQPRFNACME